MAELKKPKSAENSDLNNIITQLKKKYTDTRILSSNEIISDVKYFIKTGIITLDKIMGKGCPSGRIVEISGAESSGKTTLAQLIVSKVSQSDIITIYIDAEHALDKNRMKELNINLDKIIYNTPDSLEDMFDFLVDAITIISDEYSGKQILIVIDSIAACIPRAILEGGMDDNTMGLAARLINKGLTKVNKLLAKCNATLLIINQVRDKIGVMFGEKETTMGGRALKFYSSIRLKTKLDHVIFTDGDKDTKKAIGIVSKIKCIKNKVSRPFDECLLPIYFNETGIEISESVFEYLLSYGKITSSVKGWFEIAGIDKFRKGDFSEVYSKNRGMIDDVVLSV
jgi:recombination protein RecA